MEKTQRRLETGCGPEDLGERGAFLVVVHGPDSAQAGRVVEVDTAEFVVGREPDGPGYAVSIDDQAASRRHCVLQLIEGALVALDAGSTNGTFVNGHPLTPHRQVVIHDGDALRTGDTIFVVRYQRPDEAGAGDPDLPGRSPAMRTAREWIRKVAPLDAPVLLGGETGTGKEYAARAVHTSSSHSNGSFVPVNCGELDGNLARAELFGALKGAYTGLSDARRGLVSEADRGTLFLDEIGELSLDVQKALLRFLQDGTYRQIGGLKTSRSSARIVAATHVDLTEAVLHGTFREDLLGRIRAVAPIQLPPLRERKEDIVGWARQMARSIAREDKIAFIDRWEAGFAEALLVHDWPRNIRELKEVMLTVLLSADGANRLTANHLPEEVTRARQKARRTPRGGTMRETDSPPPSVPAAEREAWTELVRALTAHRGNVNEVAKEMGTYRKRVYRLIDRYGIELESFR